MDFEKKDIDTLKCFALLVETAPGPLCVFPVAAVFVWSSPVSEKNGQSRTKMKIWPRKILRPPERYRGSRTVSTAKAWHSKV